MFTWLNKQGVRNSNSFDVQSTGRFTFEYREGPLVVTIPVEPGNYGGGASVSIPADAFSHWDNSRMELSAQKQTQMRANFVEALKFQDIVVEP